MRRIVAREHTGLTRRRHPAGVRAEVQAVDHRPGRAERPRGDANAGDGHRHRRPVGSAARVAAEDGRLVPAAGRPGRAADRQCPRPRLRHRPRRATPPAGEPAVGHQRRGPRARHLPVGRGDLASAVRRPPGRLLRPVR